MLAGQLADPAARPFAVVVGGTASHDAAMPAASGEEERVSASGALPRGDLKTR